MAAAKSPATKALLLTGGGALLDVYSYLPTVLSGGPGLFVAVGVSFFFLVHASLPSRSPWHARARCGWPSVCTGAATSWSP
jgi:hypothetical protein